MRKFLMQCLSGLIIVLVIFATISTPIMAAVSDDNQINKLIKEKNQSYNLHIEQIETIMQELLSEKELYDNSTTKDLRGSPDIVQEYDISGAYKTYIIENAFLTRLKETDSFNDLLTNRVQWKVPIVTQKGESGLVTLLEDNGKLSWVATEVGESTKNWYITDDKIVDAVTNSKKINSKIDSIKIAHSYEYYTTFVYICSGEDEYLIPFSHYAKETGINNGQLYTVSEVSKKFDDCFEEVFSDGPTVYGSGPIFKNQPNRLNILLVCGIFAVGMVVLMFIIKQKNRE